MNEFMFCFRKITFDFKGFYGPPACRQKCMCVNNAQCEPLTGRCLCHSGHIGRYCERCMSFQLLFIMMNLFCF